MDEASYYRQRTLKRCIQRGMKQNGYKILQRNIILSDWTTRNGEYTYISFYDRTDLQRYRMWFNKDGYTDEHKSFWEVQKAGSMTFADLLNPII